MILSNIIIIDNVVKGVKSIGISYQTCKEEQVQLSVNWQLLRNL